MCGRFFRDDISWESYQSLIPFAPPRGVEAPEARYSIAPQSVVPVLRRDLDTKEVELFPCFWGLVPSWWSKPLSEKNFASFNAASETAHEMASYRGSFRHKRCLVPASGWYQWTGESGAKIPFAVSLRDDEWFCFAGLWDCAIIDGSELHSFTILTTKPNDAVAGIATRMPVVLRSSAAERWLDPFAKLQFDDLFEPYPAADTKVWVVGPDVGNVRNQGPHLIEEV